MISTQYQIIAKYKEIRTLPPPKNWWILGSPCLKQFFVITAIITNWPALRTPPLVNSTRLFTHFRFVLPPRKQLSKVWVDFIAHMLGVVHCLVNTWCGNGGQIVTDGRRLHARVISDPIPEVTCTGVHRGPLGVTSGHTPGRHTGDHPVTTHLAVEGSTTVTLETASKTS